MIEYVLSEVALAVFFGSAFQEALHWYGLRSKLQLKKTQAILRSPLYWSMTAIMMLFSVVGVYFWFDGKIGEQSLRDMFIFGAAFPLIFKSVVKSVSTSQTVKLGSESGETFGQSKTNILKLYFGA